MRKAPFSRISITLPRELLAAADRRARELDRSRSWVVAEALRGYVGAAAPAPGTVVRESARLPYRTGLGEYRLAQLQADLLLSPERRVREAERTARVSEAVRRRRPGGGQRLLFFDHYEDYLDWKRLEEVVP